MSQPPPAEIGMPLDEVDTPALVVDLDAFERNLQRMAAEVRAAGVRHRPHAKTHKSPIVTRRQMALGAVGACCQKVSEAEHMVAGGVDDVLVSNEVVGTRKIRRLAALAGQARIGVCVDDAANVAELSAAAAAAGSTLYVLVEVEVGCGRCGVPPGDKVLAMARQVADAPGLEFDGLQCYQGAAQHIRDWDERRAAIMAAAQHTRACVDLLASNGIECRTVAGAGTGTYRFEIEAGVWNELQAGSYVFMDADYGRNLDQQGGYYADFENSLFVHASVMSTPATQRVVVDAGLKASSVDSGMPLVHGHADISYFGASDEHGNLDLSRSKHRYALGDKVALVPGHCDPTVNLYDWYVVVRGGVVQALWPVAARGALT